MCPWPSAFDRTPALPETAHDFEQRRFTGPVRSDQAHNLAAAHAERHTFEREQVSEAERDVTDAGHARDPGAAARPWPAREYPPQPERLPRHVKRHSFFALLSQVPTPLLPGGSNTTDPAGYASEVRRVRGHLLRSHKGAVGRPERAAFRRPRSGDFPFRCGSALLASRGGPVGNAMGGMSPRLERHCWHPAGDRRADLLDLEPSRSPSRRRIARTWETDGAIHVPSLQTTRDYI
jgi:hypothetical protein